MICGGELVVYRGELLSIGASWWSMGDGYGLWGGPDDYGGDGGLLE